MGNDVTPTFIQKKTDMPRLETDLPILQRPTDPPLRSSRTFTFDTTKRASITPYTPPLYNNFFTPSASVQETIQTLTAESIENVLDSEEKLEQPHNSPVNASIELADHELIYEKIRNLIA